MTLYRDLQASQLHISVNLTTQRQADKKYDIFSKI